MRRRRSLELALIVALVALVLPTARPQSLPTKKEAAVLLENAAAAANLETAGTPPFHLVAKVHYELGRELFDGAYELFWASAARYRENYKMGTAVEIRLALGDKLYVLRNTPILDLPLWRLRTTMRSNYHGFHPSNPKVDKVYSARIGGESQTCVESQRNYEWMRACFDPITKQVVSLSNALKFPEDVSSADGNFFNAEQSDFVSFGAKRYPRRIAHRYEDEKMDVEITSLDQVTRYETELFTPPTGAQAYDWCPNPGSKGKISFESMPRIVPKSTVGLLAYYVFVGADGKAKSSGPMRSGGSLLNDRMKEWIDTHKFPTYSCEGKPIPYEIVLLPPFLFPTDR